MSFDSKAASWSLIIGHLNRADTRALRLSCAMLKGVVDRDVKKLSIYYTSANCLLPKVRVFPRCTEIWFDDQPDKVPGVVRGRCKARGSNLTVVVTSESWWKDCRVGGWWKENMQPGIRLNLAVHIVDDKSSSEYIDSVLDNCLSAHLDFLVGWREVRRKGSDLLCDLDGAEHQCTFDFALDLATPSLKPAACCACMPWKLM